MTQNFQKLIFNKILENSSTFVSKVEMSFKDLTPAGKATAINFSAAITLNLIFTNNKYGNFDIDLLYEELSKEIERRKSGEVMRSQILFNDSYYIEQLNHSNRIFNNSNTDSKSIKKEIDSFLIEIMLNFADALQNHNRKPFFPFNAFISLFIYPFVNSSEEKDNLIENFKTKLKSDKSFIEIEDTVTILINELMGELMNNHTNDSSLINAVKMFKASNNTIKKEETSKNCYVATLVYEDIDHPNVEFLRNFRNEKLLSNYFGKIFVTFYYNTSPKLVVILKPYNKVQKLIKFGLDKLILILK